MSTKRVIFIKSIAIKKLVLYNKNELRRYVKKRKEKK